MTHASLGRQRRALLILVDAVAIVAAYVFADMLRCRFWMQADWPELIDGRISSVRIHIKILVFIPVVWPIVLHRLGWYDTRRRTAHWLLRTAAAAGALLGLFMAAIALLLERDLYPRFQIGLMAVTAPVVALSVRAAAQRMGRMLGGRSHRRILFVGVGREALRIRRLLRHAALDRPFIVGHLTGPWDTDDTPRVPTTAILGGVDHLSRVLTDHVVDEVIFAAPIEALAQVLPFVAQCEEIGVTAQVPAESEACRIVPEAINLHGIPMLSYSPVRHTPELLTVKRAVDVLIAVIGIALLLPIFLGCAIAIKLSSPGPVLFRQRRSGLNGREFLMLKFRTMSADAEQRRAEVAHLNESDGPVFKATNDPRRTAVGAWMRRWSLDELPQLLNVLVGDMSIVGPRPPIPEEVKQYDRWQRRRLSMRPGLTCLWQIRGRHRVGFDEWMKLDLFYIDYWSLKLDFLIMWKTVATVLSGSGA